MWWPNHYVHQGNTIYFTKNYHMDQKEWEEVTKVAQGIFAQWCAPTKTQDSSQNQVCLSSRLIFKNLPMTYIFPMFDL